ncbi:aminotransferase class V-fold PLP-dependent enzyme [Cellulosilyticum sp. I15G10I2]|uniref:aminotransferase class V-fold PLP-dependent enzyme n=1 Tax=Cellulosilyticum sp. I15G10I2 TaxID=1892843 RepID=UPI00085CD3C9|nr:aminotransferase class V-fold PLP-dependent enzyme [Cellulosilyticum sp. I15G10I2]
MKKDRDYRILFNGIEVPIQLISGKYVIPINFDNAATTPPLKKVDTFIYDNLLLYSSIGRGGQKSAYCTEAYELSRQEILNFFNLTEQDGYTTIYVKNTTEGLNFLANILCGHKMDKVLATRMEHHANDLPWRMAAHTLYIDVDYEGKLNLQHIKEKLERGQGTIKYVTVTAASNVTGYINPIHDIARLAHQYGAMIIVDAAQLVAHRRIDMKGTGKDDAIDFLVFSGHKMYAPFGSGVVIGLKEIFDKKSPYLVGGGTVTAVFDDDVYWKNTPQKNEAGTPNFLGAMSIVAAMIVLSEIGFDEISSHEERLKQRLLSGLARIPQIICYGDSKDSNRLGVVSFNIRDIHYERMAQLLADIRGVAVRSGCFCAQPYVARLLGISNEERYRYMLNKDLKLPGMLRASLGLYNTEEEVDEFLNTIEHIIKYAKVKDKYIY